MNVSKNLTLAFLKFLRYSFLLVERVLMIQELAICLLGT